MDRYIPLRVLKGLGLGAVLVSAMAAVQPAVAAEDERGDLVLTGDAQCTRCHDEYELYPVLSIGKTKHGTMADGRTPSCTNCHGESKDHLGGADDQPDRPLPDVMFGKNSKSTAAEQSASCESCHSGGNRIHWASSTHKANDVACSSCHQVHAQHDKVREKTTQAEVCFSCHKEQRMAYTKFSRHPIEEGLVTCSSCHNTHGGTGPKQLVKDTVTDTCYQCHAEKRGPFIWNHEPVQENCALCHNPHGSNIPNMLTVRAPYLCQECHGGESTHRGHAPAQDDVYTAARGCVNCHTAIHGGNSPIDSSKSRTFRQ
ncbi:DmsE family decaheme c-type cytochrome [Aestuariirhabdus litorea]|uniref:DmsE family decaheme c-type cytochrome n=1 Tax=Aestuariirhabdus litorea TaxID=2528527 RepID=A0A3P3VJQ7_9GAMM|nr:DmsE family decaheme c-type cytochrome [Aestuariirhabdus litorea]RRJ82971.1 DmsE family decaheme c-type cytochrome [Aestuariirhabdus litorea]RWW93131.1 DmsE family decaheme c-type cytochrome [Endozoicomonadaceae bacterium GTF-13]